MIFGGDKRRGLGRLKDADIMKPALKIFLFK